MTGRKKPLPECHNPIGVLFFITWPITSRLSWARSAYPKEHTQTKFLSKEGQPEYKEILCPFFCSCCTWNHSSGGFKWEDMGIAMPASLIPVLSMLVPETEKISNGSFADDLLCLTQRLPVGDLHKPTNSQNTKIGQPSKCQEKKLK